MTGPDNAPHRALRNAVSGAIARGEATPIVEVPARPPDPPSYDLPDWADITAGGDTYSYVS